MDAVDDDQGRAVPRRRLNHPTGGRLVADADLAGDAETEPWRSPASVDPETGLDRRPHRPRRTPAAPASEIAPPGEAVVSPQVSGLMRGSSRAGTPGSGRCLDPRLAREVRPPG